MQRSSDEKVNWTDDTSHNTFSKESKRQEVIKHLGSNTICWQGIFRSRYNEYSAISGYCGIAKCLCQGSHFCGWGEKIIDLHLAEVTTDMLTQSTQTSLGNVRLEIINESINERFHCDEVGKELLPYVHRVNLGIKGSRKKYVEERQHSKTGIKAETHLNALCCLTAPTNVQECCFVHRQQRSHKCTRRKSFMLALLLKPSKCLILFSIFVIAQTSFSLGFFQSRLTNDSMGFIWPLKHHEKWRAENQVKGNSVQTVWGSVSGFRAYCDDFAHLQTKKNRIYHYKME